MITKCDKKGRVYIPKKLQNKLTKEMFLVEINEGLLLIPIPENAVKELERIGKKLPDLKLEELKEEISKQAIKETSG